MGGMPTWPLPVTAPHCVAIGASVSTDGSGDPTAASLESVSSCSSATRTATGRYRFTLRKRFAKLVECLLNLKLGATSPAGLKATIYAHDVTASTPYIDVDVHNRVGVLSLGAPAAASTTAVHAAFAGNNASNNFPGPFTNPAVPRNVTVTFAAGWDGGDVTVVGTHKGVAMSEVIADVAGTTVAGVKIFTTVTSATKQAVGAAADAASIGTGTKLGIAAELDDAVGQLTVDGVGEAGTFDATYDAVTPTTAPNGAKVFAVNVNAKVPTNLVSGELHMAALLSTVA